MSGRIDGGIQEKNNFSHGIIKPRGVRLAPTCIGAIDLMLHGSIFCLLFAKLLCAVLIRIVFLKGFFPFKFCGLISSDGLSATGVVVCVVGLVFNVLGMIVAWSLIQSQYQRKSTTERRRMANWWLYHNIFVWIINLIVLIFVLVEFTRARADQHNLALASSLKPWLAILIIMFGIRSLSLCIIIVFYLNAL